MKIELLDNFEKTTAQWFKNAPNLPTGLSRWMAKWSWLFVLVSAILMTLTALGLLSAIGFISSVSYNYGDGVLENTFFAWLALAALIAILVIEFKSVSPLKASLQAGWKLLYYAQVIGVVYSVLNSLAWSNVPSNLFSTLIGALIGFYILYQIKPYFK